MGVNSVSGYHRDTMNCLYQALIELMENKPFQKITKTEIIQKAGVSHMSFYRYYKNKEDILLDRLQLSSKQLEQCYKVAGVVDRHKFWTMFYEFHRADPIYYYLIKAGYISECLKDVYQFFLRNCDYVCHVNCTCTYNEMKFFFEMGGVMGTMIYILNNADSVDCNKVALDTIRFLDSLDVVDINSGDGNHKCCCSKKE